MPRTNFSEQQYAAQPKTNHLGKNGTQFSFFFLKDLLRLVDKKRSSPFIMFFCFFLDSVEFQLKSLRRLY